MSSPEHLGTAVPEGISFPLVLKSVCTGLLPLVPGRGLRPVISKMEAYQGELDFSEALNSPV